MQWRWLRGGQRFSVISGKTGRLITYNNNNNKSITLLVILKCCCRSERQCFTSYVTKFRPVQEEECDEKYVKTCQISFSPGTVNTTTRDCYRPITRNCTSQHQGSPRPELDHCVTEYHSVCSTKHLPTSGTFIGHLTFDHEFFFGE